MKDPSSTLRAMASPALQEIYKKMQKQLNEDGTLKQGIEMPPIFKKNPSNLKLI